VSHAAISKPPRNRHAAIRANCQGENGLASPATKNPGSFLPGVLLDRYQTNRVTSCAERAAAE
jgi:hypothetical protein